MSKTFKSQLELLDSARTIAEKISGRRVVRIWPIMEGVMTYKFHAHLKNGEDLVVRFYPETRSMVAHFEPAVLRKCFALGIPTPEVLSDSLTGPKAPLHYLVYKRINGVSLSTDLEKLSFSDLKEVCKSLRNHLNLLFSIKGNGYGDLLNSSTAKFSSMKEFVQNAFDDGFRPLVETNLVSVPFLNIVQKTYDKLETILDLNDCGLVYSDLSPENIIINRENNLAGLIDFEGVLIADQLLALGYCTARYNTQPFCNAILECWDKELSKKQLVQIELYALVRALRIAKYSHLPLPTGTIRVPLTNLLPGFIPALQRLGKRLR